MKNTAKLTYSALLAALSAVLLYLAAVVPTLKLALSATAGLSGVILVSALGPVWAILSYVAASVVSLLILPQKFPAILFAMFFGVYPMAKYYIEKTRRLLVEWIIKLLYFTALCAVVLNVFPEAAIPGISHKGLLLAGAVSILVLYDFGLSMLISGLLPRIERAFKRK